MAKYVIPPREKEIELVKCYRCGTLYSPEYKDPFGDYEACPTCQCSVNDKGNLIPLWKYNLIRYWRGLFRKNMEGK